MNCADFERRLVELIAGESVAEADERLRRLREHSRDCDDCRDSDDLLLWLELPREQRDPAEAPVPEYWQDFNRRLDDRMEREDAPRRLRAGWWVAAAAALVLVLVGPRFFGPDPGDPESPPILVDSGAEIDRPMPEALVELLAGTSNDDLLQGIPWSVGSPSGDEPALGEPVEGRAGGLLPDAAGLDDEGQRQLLEWLRARTQGVSS